MAKDDCTAWMTPTDARTPHRIVFNSPSSHVLGGLRSVRPKGVRGSICWADNAGMRNRLCWLRYHTFQSLSSLDYMCMYTMLVDLMLLDIMYFQNQCLNAMQVYRKLCIQAHYKHMLLCRSSSSYSLTKISACHLDDTLKLIPLRRKETRP